MTDDHFLENKLQLSQIEALSAGKYRVISALYGLVPVIRRLAEDDAAAAILLAELEAAEVAMKAESIAAGSFIAERKESTSSP